MWLKEVQVLFMQQLQTELLMLIHSGTSIKVAPNSGRQKTTTDEETIEKVHETEREMEKEVDILYRLHCILHQPLDLRKPCARWI